MKIKHKGLRRYAETGSLPGIDAAAVGKLSAILRALSEAPSIEVLDSVDAWRLHPLKGRLAGHWSIRVNRIWRVTFRFEGGEAVDVDRVDYQ